MYTNFWGGTTHLIKQDSIPFYNWYQHHYYQLYHDDFNFGHCVPSAVLALRMSNGFADVIWTCKILEGENSSYDAMLTWSSLSIKWNNKGNEGKSNNLPLWRTRLWRLARKISELAKWFLWKDIRKQNTYNIRERNYKQWQGKMAKQLYINYVEYSV